MKALKNFTIFLFDMDGTLSKSKSPISKEMASILEKILMKKKIGIISGGTWEQFETQVIHKINNTYYKNLLILPTTGTQLYFFDEQNNSWKKSYDEALSSDERRLIISSLQNAVKAAGFSNEKVYGIRFEDRGSQITYSALGSRAPFEEKKQWDIDQEKRKYIISFLPKEIHDHYSITIGGTTSIDITKKNIDKAYAVKKIHDLYNIEYNDMLFFGDKLQSGGNDYPVKKLLSHAIEVSSEEDTYHILHQYTTNSSL